MTDLNGFSLEISSRYDGFWRYNVALTCGCFDAQDNSTGFVSTESHIADVGASLPQKPEETPAGRSIVLNTPPCDHLLCYLYIIPHTLPTGREVEGVNPFGIELSVAFAGKTIRTETRLINQWSGASIEMRIEKK